MYNLQSYVLFSEGKPSFAISDSPQLCFTEYSSIDEIQTEVSEINHANFPDSAAHHAAVKAAKALRVEWDCGLNKKVDSAALANAAEALAENPENYGNWVLDGDPGRAISESQKTLTARYTTELNIHAPLEPVNAIVEFKDGLWHAWAGNQNQSTAVPFMAQALDVEQSELPSVHPVASGGYS